MYAYYRNCKADRSTKRFNGKECGAYLGKRQLSEGQKVYFKPRGQRYGNRKCMPITIDEIITGTEKAADLLKGYVLIGNSLDLKVIKSIILQLQKPNCTLLEKGNYNPCETVEYICPVYRLFGFAG